MAYAEACGYSTYEQLLEWWDLPRNYRVLMAARILAKNTIASMTHDDMTEAAKAKAKQKTGKGGRR